MEPATQHDDVEDCFFDAVDDSPFYDCNSSDQSDTSTTASTLTEPSPGVTSPASTLRRRSAGSGPGQEDSNPDSLSTESRASQIHDSKKRYRGRRYKLYSDLNENNKNLDVAESAHPSQDRGTCCLDDEDQKKDESTVTTANDDRVGDSVDSVGEHDESASPNLLLFVAGLVIKAIGFQFSLFVYFITFPIWVLHCCYLLVFDPFGAIRRSRGFVMQKLVSLWNLICGSFSFLLGDWIMEHKTVWDLLLRLGWGLLWSIYVGIILCGLLVFAVMVSGFCMWFLVEEPMQLREDLNFDYTKPSPVAFVPIMSCDAVGCGVDCKEEIANAKNFWSRTIPRNHKLQVRVLLTLPESEYNRNLGNFQVRVDFLSANGKIIASKRHPCMLKFKSDPIRLLLTLLEAVPLVAGFVSESQNLELKIRGFTEGDVHTSCLRVIIEQRAEFQPAAGIPEIYDASLVLESELPFLKMIIWSWKKTLFIWITITSFVTELLFTLICCRPLIIPRMRLRDGSTINNVPERR